MTFMPGQTEEKAATVIAEDVRIKGSMSFETSLLIRGTFEGEIVSQGLLVAAPTARIEATIVTERLVSSGEITGEVTAREVVLKGSAVQKGSVATSSLVVDSGALFNGSCVMKRETPAFQNQPGEDG